jgi:hypothetical protein
LEGLEVVQEYLANKTWEEEFDLPQDLECSDALDYPEHADHAQHVEQQFRLFGEYLEEF